MTSLGCSDAQPVRGGAASVPLNGDVTGPSNANTLRSAIDTAVTWLRVQIPADTYPPSRGVFGVAADGSDPRSLLSYFAFGSYRSLGIGGGVSPATLDAAGIYSEDSDTHDAVGLTLQGQRAFFLFNNTADPVASLGYWSPTFTRDRIYFRNEYADAPGIDVAITGYDAGDTAPDATGGALDLGPGAGRGRSDGAPLRLYAGHTGTAPGIGSNGLTLALTVQEPAVVLHLALDATGQRVLGATLGDATHPTTYDGGTIVRAQTRDASFATEAGVSRYYLTADALTITLDDAALAVDQEVDFVSMTGTANPGHTFAASSGTVTGAGVPPAPTAPWPNGAGRVTAIKQAAGVFWRG